MLAHFTPNCFAFSPSLLDLFIQIQDPGRGNTLEVRHGDIFADRLREDQAVGLAVFGEIGDAVFDRLRDSTDVDLPAALVHLAGDRTAVALAEYTHGKFRAARAHQTGQTYDLASAQLDIRMLDDELFREFRMVHAPVFHFKENVFAGLVGSGRVAVAELPADHMFNQRIFADLRCVFKVCHGPAVAQDRDGVCNVTDLVEFMGNDDTGDALLLKGLQQI